MESGEVNAADQGVARYNFTSMSKKLRRRLMIYFSIGLGGTLLYGIIRWVGWRRIVRQFLALGPMGFSLFFLNAILMFFLWALTWRILLDSYGIERSWGEVLGAFAGGYTVTYITPSANFGGEPVRVYLITHGFTTQAAEATSSVIVERFLNMASATLLVFIGSMYGLFSNRLTGWVRLGLFIWASAGMAFMGWSTIYFVRRHMWMTRFLRFLGRLIPWRGYIDRAADWFVKVEREIDDAFSSGHRHKTIAAFVPAFFSSVLFALNPLIFVYFTQGIVLSVLDLSLIFALSMFLNMFLWVTPGGMGIVAGGMIGIFSLFGISKAAAVGFSFALKLTEILFVLIGVSYMLARGTSHLLQHPVSRPADE